MTPSMLCAIPFCSSDAWLATELCRWIWQLGGVSRHDALLVVDPATPWTDVLACRKLLEPAFKSVGIVTSEHSISGWLPGSVSLFKTATAAAHYRPFFWLEPDAVPLKATWLDELEDNYQRCGKKFMGAMVSHQKQGLPSPYLEGCAVYPADALDIMGPVWRDDQSWTFACAGVVVPQAVNTPLVQHLWGETGRPPTFADRNIPNTNVFSLRALRPEAVVFHRCKNLTLINELRKRAKLPTSNARDFVVLFPFCAKDVSRFINVVQWMKELRAHYEYDAVISTDLLTTPGCCEAMLKSVQSCFRSVSKTRYPIKPEIRWPTAASIAFKHAAEHVAMNIGRPFLWLEFDMIPLKAEWLDVLWERYISCGKHFMGPIVPQLGHMNGTGVYPADTPQRIPNTLRNPTGAWDTTMKSEMIHDCHDCSDIFHHVWGVDKGQLHPFKGDAPNFSRYPNLLGQIKSTAVVFHRCKDGSLIEHLRSKRK